MIIHGYRTAGHRERAEGRKDREGKTGIRPPVCRHDDGRRSPANSRKYGEEVGGEEVNRKELSSISKVADRLPVLPATVVVDVARGQGMPSIRRLRKVGRDHTDLLMPRVFVEIFWFLLREVGENRFQEAVQPHPARPVHGGFRVWDKLGK